LVLDIYRASGQNKKWGEKERRRAPGMNKRSDRAESRSGTASQSQTRGQEDEAWLR
jgi:hypothetical protein